MRCIHLVWTKYYVTDGLGVKMHGLPLVYIYIYVHDNCATASGVQLYSLWPCRITSCCLSRLSAKSCVGTQWTWQHTRRFLSCSLSETFSCWQTLVWMQHRHCILMPNLWFKIKFATGFCWKPFCLKLNLPQIFDLHFLPHTLAQIDDYCSLNK